MENFFARVSSRAHPWPADRADLHWHILHPTAMVEEHLVGPYRDLTGVPGLARVEARWVHTTLMHGGPIADYQPGEIDEITRRVAAECAELSPVELTYDRPSIGVVAVEVGAWPGAATRHLWELTTRIDAEATGGRFPRTPTAHYPHASLAYGAADAGAVDRQALKVALSDSPGRAVTLPVTSISLVAQSHDNRFITWEHLATVPLSGGR
ncbi:2'-5' RNA ligase family protein [Streptomyces sp. NPDC056844]|uniref:2'-5' RNA ligase family protein n=1 Tax=unclassified Streptomyces TaxID=2593676 RepID=UPI0036CDBAFF